MILPFKTSFFTREPAWFWMAAILLVAWRFWYLGPEIDQPHSWRQMDTANYIWAFYKDGIDLFHPSVCWMGGHKTLILEFPLPEAIAAMAYKVLGPDLVWARLVFLAFFVGACIYLYKVFRLLFSPDLSRLAILIYMTLPLAFYYSRAVHIDFAAVFFAHAMLFHFMRGIQGGNHRQMALGAGAAVLGLLIKAPYVFYFMLPLGLYMVRRGQWDFLLRCIPYFLVPVMLFAGWQWHVYSVNVAAPEWDFIPTYHKFHDQRHWYFGPWEIRWMPELWPPLFSRFIYEVVGKIGLALFVIGICLKWREWEYNWMRLWFLATLVYLIVFFPLNYIHNYYQIPFLAPAAFFIAVPLHWVAEEMGKQARVWYPITAIGAVLIFALNTRSLTHHVHLNEKESKHFANYFEVEEIFVEFGQVVQAQTPETALIIAAYGGLDCRSPHLLYNARRNGWSIPVADLSPGLIQRLRAEGASYLAIMGDGNAPAALQAYLAPLEEKRFSLPRQDKIVSLFKL